jgi:hypothetical protein
VALQGTLDTFALPDVLRLLAATKKTGQLRISGGRGEGSASVSEGGIVAIEAMHAPHAVELVDALFELLRFEDGSFTFDAEATVDAEGTPQDPEGLLADAEALLAEWRTIEAVVPSLDAWVTLRPTLPKSEVTVAQDAWTTVVAVGGGTTVRRLGDQLHLSELPISRSVKGLVELGLVEVGDAPTGVLPHANLAAAEPTVKKPSGRPLLGGDEPTITPSPTLDLKPAAGTKSGPTASGARARRSKALAAAPTQPEAFVPLELPGHGPTPSYDSASEEPELEELEVAEHDDVVHEGDDLAAAFPGLANRSHAASLDVEDPELADQLATLSPKAAQAIRAAADAATDEERDAALEAAAGDDDQPLNRGLLLKFLSSVKS